MLGDSSKDSKPIKLLMSALNSEHLASMEYARRSKLSAALLIEFLISTSYHRINILNLIF